MMRAVTTIVVGVLVVGCATALQPGADHARAIAVTICVVDRARAPTPTPSARHLDAIFDAIPLHGRRGRIRMGPRG